MLGFAEDGNLVIIHTAKAFKSDKPLVHSLTSFIVSHSTYNYLLVFRSFIAG